MNIDYYVKGERYASRTRDIVPRAGDEIRFHRVIYRVNRVVWIEDEGLHLPRVAIDLEQLFESEDIKPELQQGDTAQVIGEHKWKGRIGVATTVYWTNSRAGGKYPRWVALMQFKRGKFPIQPKLIDVALLEKLP